MSTQLESETTAPGGHQSRLVSLKDIFSRVAQQVRLHKMQVIASGVGVAAVPVAAIIYWLLIVDQEGPRTFTINQSLVMLDRGDWERTRYMATHLERAVLDDPDHWGARSFVLGATIASEAATMEERDRRTFSQLAIRYLSRSRRRRFPPGRAGQGLFLLGRAMYFVGRYEDARQVLSESLKHNPPSPIKIRGLIAATYLRDPNPDYEQALQNYEEYLQDPGLTDEDRFGAQIDRCWALYYSNQIETAEKCLEEILPRFQKRPRAKLFRVRLLIAQGSLLLATDEKKSVLRGQEQIKKAIALLRKEQNTRNKNISIRSGGSYLLIVAEKSLGNLGDALALAKRTGRVYSETPAGVAGSMLGADIARKLGRHEEAEKLYREAMSSAGNPQYFSNPWISLPKFRIDLLNAYQFYMNRQDYRRAIALSAEFPPVFSKVVSLEKTATAYRTWAIDLARQAKELPPGKAEPLAEQSTEKWRAAAKAYDELSKLRFTTRFYTEDIWDSAQAYLAGHDYLNAVRALRSYLHEEKQRLQPQAMVALAKALYSLGDVDEAYKQVELSLEFYPRGDSSYEARLLAARILMQKEKFIKAEEYLLSNLNDENLTPGSNVWRESFFTHGAMLFQKGARAHDDALKLTGAERIQELEKARGVLEQAVIRLGEAVQRYPGDPRAIQSVYDIASAHRRLAVTPEERLKTIEVRTTRLALIKQRRDLLEQASAGFSRVRRMLNRKLDSGLLSDEEQWLLRNAYFQNGAMLFQMGEYREAARVFAATSSRYQDKAVSLDAFVKLAECYRRLGNTEEALGVLQQSKVVAKQLPKEAFEENSVFSQQEWLQHLDWIVRQIDR